MNNTQFGNIGEQIAEEYLKKKGYKILEKNWRVGHYEIDIICKKNDEIIFIEVKTRNTSYFGFPENAVNKKKQRFLGLAANSFIQQYQIDSENRFDIISIILDKNEYELEHIEDAFYPIL